MTANEAASRTNCSVGDIVLTFALGVLLGATAGVVLAVGSHFIHEFTTSNAIATQSLLVSIVMSAIGGTLFGFIAAIGAVVALLVGDFRLNRSRWAQALIAGIGATLPSIALVVFIEQQGAMVDYMGTIWVFALVFISAFALMMIRAANHKTRSAGGFRSAV